MGKCAYTPAPTNDASGLAFAVWCIQGNRNVCIKACVCSTESFFYLFFLIRALLYLKLFYQHTHTHRLGRMQVDHDVRVITVLKETIKPFTIIIVYTNESCEPLRSYLYLRNANTDRRHLSTYIIHLYCCQFAWICICCTYPT